MSAARRLAVAGIALACLSAPVALAQAPSEASATPAGSGRSAGEAPSEIATTAPPEPDRVEPAAAADALVAALEATVARADADIVSEVEAGGYRIGLIVGPSRSLRPRSAVGTFIPPDDPDPALTFVGVVLREPRTKRFLPSARVHVNFEMETGGEMELTELAGAYPVYGINMLVPKPGTARGPNGPDDLRGITVRVEPPAYARHAEMLGAFAGDAETRFVITPKAGARAAPWHTVANAVKPAPVAEDWKIGDDLRMAIGECRELKRRGEFLAGFIAEGPEPIWLWKGESHPPEHMAVGPEHNTHLEMVLVHERTGLMVTGAGVQYRFWRRTSPDAPREEKTFTLHPLLAEFYHYGLTADVPPGTWNVSGVVAPPRIDAWGDGPIGVPELGFSANFTFTREAPGTESPAVEAARLSRTLKDAAAKYAAGDREAALQETTEAFFSFEGSSLDARLRVSDPSAYKSLEADWIGLRGRMQAGGPAEEIQASAAAVGDRLVALAKDVGDGAGGGWSAFVQAFLVLLREGFEAILVLGLIVAVLRKTGRSDAIGTVRSGSISALVASAVLAAAFLVLFRNVASGGRAREAFEGVTMLLAVVVLFFTSFWLISRVEGRRWAAFIKNQIESAVTSGRRRTIWALAFLVVFREGAETVLLYASLFASTQGAVPAILGGIGAASVALVVLFFVFMRGGAALPVRPFFGVTGALLYVLAFKFAGDGIAELQAAGFVPVTPVAWIPDSPVLQTWLGVQPTAQSAALQGVLLLAVVAGLGWMLLRRPEVSVQPGAASG